MKSILERYYEKKGLSGPSGDSFVWLVTSIEEYIEDRINPALSGSGEEEKE